MPAAAWRRGVRVTLTAIGAFYGCRYGLGDPTMALYAVFAVLAFSLLSQTSGPPAVRTRTLLACLAFGLVDVTIATYAAVNTWVAVVAMFVFGFLVSFAGVCGVRVSEVSTGLQLLFILPSLPPFDPGSLGSRLVGLTLGMALLIVTDRLLLPDPGPPGFENGWPTRPRRFGRSPPASSAPASSAGRSAVPSSTASSPRRRRRRPGCGSPRCRSPSDRPRRAGSTAG